MNTRIERWTGTPVKEVVWKAVLKFTIGDGNVEFAPRQISELILEDSPKFKVSNVGCELRADCVNNPKRHEHYRGKNHDRYWQVAHGKYRFIVSKIAEQSWWDAKKKLTEQFNLTKKQVDELRATRVYKKCVFDLMLGQRGSLEEFEQWLENYNFNNGRMDSKSMSQTFARRMGLDAKVIPTMVEDVRKAHAEIVSGTRKPLKMIPDPYQRRHNYKHILYKKQGHKCNGCEGVFPFSDLEIDHIMPTSRGGRDIPENWQLLCRACNARKSNRTQAEWI